jgi:Ca2+-binding EF-hand superfamily protein
MLQRPVVNYSKKDVLEAFSFISGKSNPSPGFISEEKLSRALYHGNGGADPLLVEEIMTMVEHNTGARLNYQELVDLMMGSRGIQSTPSFGATAGPGANTGSKKIHRRGVSHK